MIIVSDDRKGIGRIKGDFVYIRLDRNYLDCGISIANAESYDGFSLSEWSLVDGYVDSDPDFFSSRRSPLDDESTERVAILTKDEVGKMIESLQDVYSKMK